MSLRRWLGVLLLSAIVPAGAQDSVPTPTISLITFAPGEVYWQRFGHNALLVREPGGSNRLYNYGIFDFHQKNFFLNFARGQMLYRLDEAPLEWALQPYRAEGRWALEQQLALTAAQAQEAAAFLAWNVQPQNADYRYDYFLSNCSTKTRDVIDQVLDGQLRAQLEPRAGRGSFRSEVLDLMAPVPALMIGMDLGLGSRVDARLTAWQDAFIPMRLMDELRSLRITRGDRDDQSLVAQERWLLPPLDADLAPPTAPRLWPALLLTGVLVAGLLAGLHRSRRYPLARVALGALSLSYAGVCGLLGLVLLLGWVGTEHWSMAANHNLLLLHPLWWLLLPALVRASRRDAPSPGAATRGIAAVSLLAALVALPLSLFGAQPNLHWVALLLPIHVLLLVALLRPSPR